MKKSITVLGIEADGIRGVRLEEAGADWNCVDGDFWPIGSGRCVEDEKIAEDDAPLSADDRYAAMVDSLKDASKRFGASEVVLSMPLSSLLVKVSRTSVDERDSLSETAGAELGKVSPFPDETLVAGIETVAETDRDLVTMFAALPESEAADIGDAFDEAKVRVLRTDITALGWLRTLWPRIVSQSLDSSRRVVLMNLDDGWDVVVLDENSPSLLRGLGAISDPAELGRELTLSLLQAGANIEAGEIVVFTKREVSEDVVMRLKAFAPVRIERVEEIDANWGVDGVARRTLEGATLDVTPNDWSDLREEARFKKKLTTFLAVAAAGWVVVMGTLFGGPMVYDQLTQHQKAICKRHAKAYKAVKEMRDKVKLVQQYSDHARGTLEMLKAVSDRMPEGITLTSFNYRRGEKLSLSGEADQPTVVYDFKNALTEAEIILAEAEEDADKEGIEKTGADKEDSEKEVADKEGGEEEEVKKEVATEKLFAEVNLSGPSKSRNAHKFSIECLFESAEEEGK